MDAYNEAVRNGRAGKLSPPRSAKSGAPKPIETPPFYAIPICAGITNTFGGIAIDGYGRVRRRDGSVIEGLYAAGGCTGGLEGGGALGYVGGLIKACVLGLRAGEDAARRRRAGGVAWSRCAVGSHAAKRHGCNLSAGFGFGRRRGSCHGFWSFTAPA